MLQPAIYVWLYPRRCSFKSIYQMERHVVADCCMMVVRCCCCCCMSDFCICVCVWSSERVALCASCTFYTRKNACVRRQKTATTTTQTEDNDERKATATNALRMKEKNMWIKKNVRQWFDDAWETSNRDFLIFPSLPPLSLSIGVCVSCIYN